MWSNLIGNCRKPFIVSLAILCLAFLSGCASLMTYNPATGREEFIFIPTLEEITMGQSIHRGLAREMAFSTNKQKVDRLQAIGERVARVSDRQDYPYHFFLVDKDELNAFTTPGGNIYFYTKLMDDLGTDDRIAAVLAHEIGHCAARHVVKKFQASMGYDLVSGVMMERLGISETAKAITKAGLNATMQIVFSSYSRQDEYEADRLSIKYLILSGYRPEGMVETLRILQQETKGDNVPLIVRTHPYLSDRITAADKEISATKAKFAIQ